MHFSDAQHLLQVCGAARFLVIGDNSQSLAAELGQRGASVLVVQTLEQINGAKVDCVVVECLWALGQSSLVDLLDNLLGFEPRWVMIRFAETATGQKIARSPSTRSVFERAALAKGFRRALQDVTVEKYLHRPRGAQMPSMLDFERIPQIAKERWPHVEASSISQDDMSRNLGPGSDDHMVRYAVAAGYVRPGDTVLDVGCGAGFGSAIIAAQSVGKRFVGIDADPGAIEYAKANFGEQYAVEYVSTPLPYFASIADSSIDMCVSFHVFASMADYQVFLSEAKRVLRPDGRIICGLSVAQDGVGAKSNSQSSSQGGDIDDRRQLFAEQFLVEERWSQAAVDDHNLPSARPTLEQMTVEGDARAGGWIILVGSVDPLENQSRVQFEHPAFNSRAGSEVALVAFGDHYENPWLYRSMVQLGERVKNRDVLNDLAARVLGRYRQDTADFGAALTVLGYAVLETPTSPFVDDVLALVAEYLDVSSSNPHVGRWQISSAFVAAKLSLAKGMRAHALGLFEWITHADFLAFSPLLATKVIASHFHLGVMSLADSDLDTAAVHFRAGVSCTRTALAADDRAAIGSEDAPFAFGFSELAEVADMGAQCAMALKLLPLYPHRPGVFWQKVDLKRFGVVTWAQALERENLHLRRRLGG